MNARLLVQLILVLVMAFRGRASGQVPLRTVAPGTNQSSAMLRVRIGRTSSWSVPRFITGKFCEHLGANIYKGMDAQILVNPTFAAYPFAAGSSSPDGLVNFQTDERAIDRDLVRQAGNFGWPEAEISELQKARRDGLAAFWTRVGSDRDVVPSPDAGPVVGRAQRVQVRTAGKGIAQWIYLPLDRVRRYEFEMLIRSPDIHSFSVALSPADATSPAATAHVTGVSNEWKRFAGHLQVNADSPAAVGYRLALLADSPGQFVIQRLLLRPEDHVDGADPDVIRLLRESHLPLLRWPGGNFVSAYHWQDGVGPVEHRPTLPNYAWGGVEPNLFGTEEFIAFCRAVVCEPMICINAGTGTPEEAARWVEYCNGSPSSPMGRLRAAKGSPAPFRVKYWEVGNELWGRWQADWTTAGGYVDRYRQFARVMRAADPTITLYACGAPALWGKEWNQTLVTALGKDMPTITDHPLIGGTVSASADPMDVYRDFMAVPEVLQARWQELRQSMAMAGVSSPRLAITELQVFAKAGSRVGTEPEHLTASNLVNQASQGEALYDILVYHAALRLAPFVELVTHSAVVNHGGGLRKQHERVYANPCHYAQGAFAALAGATLIPVEIECAQERAPLVLPDLQHAVPEASYGAIDALAATKDGSLWLSIVHRGASGLIDLAVMLEDAAVSGQAEVLTLSADAPWERNTLEEPERIKPVVSSIPCHEGRLELQLQPFSFTRIRLPLPK